jgi:protein gp37
MIDISKGRYWDDGPVIVKGCTRISPGCDNCWLLSMTRRYQKGQGFVNKNEWTGKIETNIDRLIKVCKPKTQRVISLWGDLFHEDVPKDFIAKALDAAFRYYIDRGHVFLILTKRPAIMAREVTLWQHYRGLLLDKTDLYFGLTVCNQQEWNDKGKLFLQIPGKKFISHEPALERIDYGEGLKQIDCLISGGETGPGARPSHPETFRADRDQCKAASTDFFFKGWGQKFPESGFLQAGHEDMTGREIAVYFKHIMGSKRYLDGVTHDDLPWRKP